MLDFDTFYNYCADQLVTNQFFSATALFSAITGAVYTMRRVPQWIWSRIHRRIYFTVAIEQETFLYDYVLEYIKLKYPKSLRRLEAKGKYNGDTVTEREIVYNQENDSNYIWYNRRRLSIFTTKEKLEHAENYSQLFNRTYHLGGLLAEKAIKKFIDEALQHGIALDVQRAAQKQKIKIYTVNSSFYSGWGEHIGASGKTFDAIFMENKQAIINDLEFFKEQKELYERLHVPYKRGYIFYGPPGNGKSALAYAIAEYMKYDIYSLTLSGMRDDDIVKTFARIPSKSIILVEDIDSFFEGREPKGENKVSFSAFLNVLSGVAQKSDILTIFTTNKFESLDPALLRDSRCDFSFMVNNPSKEVAEAYLSHVFQKEVVLSSMPDISFAALQNITLKNNHDLTKVINILQDGTSEIPSGEELDPLNFDALPNCGKCGESST